MPDIFRPATEEELQKRRMDFLSKDFNESEEMLQTRAQSIIGALKYMNEKLDALSKEVAALKKNK